MADGTASRFNTYTTGPNTGTPVTTAGDERLLDAVLAMPGAGDLLMRPGVRPGGGFGVSVGGSPESVILQPGLGIMTDTGAGGSFKIAVGAAVTVPLPTRPASGQSRISDLVGIIKNDEVRPADGAREVDVQLLNGAPGASPTPPTVPDGAIRFRRLTIPATGSVAFSLPPQRIAALGGTLPVASDAERDAIEDIYDGLIVYREDTDIWQGRANGDWVDIPGRIDTGWASIPLHTGFTAETGPPAATPQKRTLQGREVKLRGRVNGTFAPSSVIVIADAGAVPSPPRQWERQISGNSAPSTCRAYIATNGSITVVTGASAPVYVYLDGLSGYMLD